MLEEANAAFAGSLKLATRVNTAWHGHQCCNELMMLAWRICSLLVAHGCNPQKCPAPRYSCTTWLICQYIYIGYLSTCDESTASHRNLPAVDSRVA